MYQSGCRTKFSEPIISVAKCSLKVHCANMCQSFSLL